MPHFPALCRTLRRTLCHNKPPNVPQSTPPRIKASNSSIVPPDQQRILRVSIVGAANAGKSSLFNRLIQLWASAVSHCYNTTRTNLIGCCTRGRDQVVLVDTPGTSHPDTLKRHKIDPGILERPNEANLQCDMILCVVDGGTKRTCSSLHEILFDSLLGFLDKKLILVFNKVDMVENKADVLDRISQITGGIVGGKNIIIKNNKYLDRMEEQDLQYCRSQSIKSKSDGFQHFNRVFVTSSLDCTGLDDLKDFLFQSTVKGYWIYNCDMKVKATETDLLENYLIEKLLEYFPQNLIYRCKIVIDDPIAAMDIQYYKVKLYVKHFYRKKFLDHRMTHYLHEVCTMVNKHMSDILCRQVSVNVAFLDRECLNMS